MPPRPAAAIGSAQSAVPSAASSPLPLPSLSSPLLVHRPPAARPRRPAPRGRGGAEELALSLSLWKTERETRPGMGVVVLAPASPLPLREGMGNWGSFTENSREAIGKGCPLHTTPFCFPCPSRRRVGREDVAFCLGVGGCGEGVAGGRPVQPRRLPQRAQGARSAAEPRLGPAHRLGEATPGARDSPRLGAGARPSPYVWTCTRARGSAGGGGTPSGVGHRQAPGSHPHPVSTPTGVGVGVGGCLGDTSDSRVVISSLGKMQEA